MELLCHIHRILAGHGVDDQDRLVYRHGFLDLLKLFHHVLINMKASRRIQDHDVIAVLLSMFQGGFGDIRRLMVVAHGKYFHTLLLTVHLQLLDRRRPVHVAGNEKRLLAFQLILACQLCSGRRLTCSLKARHHDDRNGASRLKLDLHRLGSHQLHKLFIHDLDDHLPRI